MSVTISFANLKGGVGKTTSANAFAAGLTRRGYKVLCIDMDPQGNLSLSIGADADKETPTIYEVIKAKASVSDAIQHFSAFDIIPSNIGLSQYEVERRPFLERLGKVLNPLSELYDYIIIDTAPSLGLLTVMSFFASNEIIVPSFAEYFSVSGIELLVSTIRQFQAEADLPDLKIDGILLTQMNPRTLNAQAVVQATRKYIEGIQNPSIGENGFPLKPMYTKIYKTFIRKAVALSESQSFREDIFTYSPNSTVAQDYSNFIDEYLSAHGKENKNGKKND